MIERVGRSSERHHSRCRLSWREITCNMERRETVERGARVSLLRMNQGYRPIGRELNRTSAQWLADVLL